MNDAGEQEGGRLLVYRSSAGSGKTSILVSTFLERVLASPDETRYGRILAITFTNKAAKEMKERVLEELATLAEGKSPPSPPTANAIERLGLDPETVKKRASQSLTHLLHHYSRLSISTIDRFVHRIVQQFARELGLPVDFELITEEEDVLQRAVDLLIARAGRSEKSLTTALTGFAVAKASDDKSWHIERDLLDASWTLLDEEGHEDWEKLKEMDPDGILEIRKELGEKRKAFEDRLISIADKGLSMIEEQGVHPKSFHYGTQGGVPSYLQKLKRLDPADLTPSNRLLKALEADKWVSGKCPRDEADRIHAISEELKRLIQDAKELVEREAPVHLFRCLVHDELYRLSLLRGVEKGLEQIEEEEGLLLISELDRIIAKVILQEPAPFIYERIGDRYDDILFDEFQDTSVLQWQNLLPLVENSLSEGNTVMLVGDGKQAIYRWRNGDVEQFLKLPDIHRSQEEDGLKQEKEELFRSSYQNEQLEHNFRSAPVIVRTNNEIFPELNRVLMDGCEEVGMPHLKELFDSQEQKVGREGNSGYVRFERKASQTQAQKRSEGNHIVERCVEIVQETLQHSAPSEIAVLTRTNAKGAGIAAALMEEGIDVLSGESLHLDQNREVNFIINLMRIIEDPSDEISKLACIRGFLERMGSQRELHPRLLPFWSTDEKGKEGRIDLIGFFEANDVNFDPDEARRFSLYQCGEDIIRRFDLDGPANPYLQFFLDHLYDRSDKFGNDLQGFLEEWDGMRNKPSIKVPEELDAVRVMTVHASKGLEFPYLILPEPEQHIRLSKDRIWVDPDGYIPELPVALVPVGKRLQKAPAPYALEEARERYRTRLDALNLLYVAMTRASEALYVLMSEPPSEGDPKDRIDNALIQTLEKLYGSFEEELEFGTIPEAASASSGDAEESILDRIHHEAWDDRVRIRYQAPEDWDLEDPGSARDLGTLTHELLARIERKEQLSRTLEEMVNEGKLSEKGKERFALMLQNIMEQQEAASFFDPSPKQKLLNERELLTGDGSFIRPDRVLIEGKEAHILEIKTGDPNPSHHRQLGQYKRALEAMGYHCRGLLLYTQGATFEPLNEGIS